MPSEIKHRHPDEVGDPDGNLQFNYKNWTNTPIDDGEYLETGQSVAGLFEIEWTAATTVKVTSLHPSKHPFDDTGISVTCDGSTWNYNVIPGCRFQFNSGCALGWKAKVSIGPYMTAVDTITNIFNFGVVRNGQSTSNFKIAAVNVGDEDSADTYVDAIPGSYYTGDDEGDFVVEIFNDTDETRHKLAAAGTYVLTFSNWQDDPGGSGFKSADIYVNKDGGGALKAVEDALFDGETVYQYGEAAYDDVNDYFQGMGIILANTSSDPTSTTITVKVMDGYSWVEFAPDSGGSPGTWQSGPLELTEVGESDGTITTGNLAYWWVRWTLPSSADPDDIRLIRLKTWGLTI